MDPQALSNLMVAVLLALGTVGTMFQTRSRRRGRELRRLQQWVDEAWQYIWKLRRKLTEAGIEPPPIPSSLTEGEDDDDN